MGREIRDLTGQRFGDLVVLKRVKKHEKGNARFLARCEVANCGKEIEVLGSRLTTKFKPKKHCGCLTNKNLRSNLLGKKFGMLKVIGFVKINKRHAIWLVRCDCKKEIEVAGYRLVHKNTPMTHCGCLTFQHQSEGYVNRICPFYIHGQSQTPEYKREKKIRRRVQLRNPFYDSPTYTRLVDRCFEKHNFCVYCGVNEFQEKMTIDHILPVSKGGTNDSKNLITACMSCNQSKGKKLFIDWYNENKGFINTLEEILDYMEFESLKHLTNYQSVLIDNYQNRSLY